MWPSKKNKARELEQEQKIAYSQGLLIDAAVSTVEMAQYVASQLKERLDDTIKQFEATMAIMSDGLLICDTDGNIKACNPASQNAFGYDFDEVVKLNITNLFLYQNNRIKSPSLLWKILKKDSMQDTVMLNGIRKSKEIFKASTTITKLSKSDGNVVYLLLIKSDSDVDSFFNISFDTILIVQNSVIVAANKQAGKMFKCRAENLVSRDISSILNMNCSNRLNGEGCLNCVCGKLALNDDEIHEINALRDDGSSMVLLFSGADIIWNGAPACLISARDILSTSTYDKRYIDLGEMTCFFDKDFKITFANERFCQYYNTRAIGLDVRTIFETEKERNAFMLNIGNLSMDRPTRRIQFCYDMDTVHDWTDHAVFDEKNDIVEIQHTVRDISTLVSENTRELSYTKQT